jgi:hypothetical protein
MFQAMRRFWQDVKEQIAGLVNYCEWLMRKAEQPKLSLGERQTSDV